MLVYPIGTTEACTYAARSLQKAGVPLVDHPTPEVTHLLLDVPSFGPDGALRDGGDIRYHLERLPQTTTVAGGNLNHPALAEHQKIDLLADPEYLAMNAAITADCALRVAAREMKTVFRKCPVLILGWGRIGKCLGQLLRALDCNVTIAARKDADIAMIQGLGYHGQNIYDIRSALSNYQVIFNTVPEGILEEKDLQNLSCIQIDLASQPGIYGTGAIWARGLPGIYAPQSSGELIAQRFLKLAGRN